MNEFIIRASAQGCSLEESLLTNLHYDDDLTASQTATVFKYANNAQLFFNCQIRVTLKEPGTSCQVGLLDVDCYR
jgi:hypothetical protein